MYGRRNWGAVVTRGGVGLVGLFLVAIAAPAAAHSGEESYVYLEIFDETIEGRIEYPVSDLGDVLDLDIPQDVDGAAEAVASNLELIHEYSRQRLTLGGSAGGWNIVFDGFDILKGPEWTYAVLPFVVDEQLDPMPRSFDVSYSGIIEEKNDKSALLIIGTDWRSGTFNNEAEHLLVFTPDRTDQRLSLEETSWFSSFSAVVGLGVEHIQIGSDHILFIVALLLPAVLIFYPELGWRPAQSFGSSLWRVVKIATSFTIAHTVTLTLGGLGVIEISPSIVEPIIAISIGLAALHNLRPVFFNREWLIAFAFGLFHGFGFAGLLADLGLDRSNRIVSLLGFNVGIELGQVAIIVLLFPALFLLRRTRFYSTFMKVGSIVLTAVAFGWFVDRVFSLDLGVDRVVEPLLAWPRPLWLVAVLTVLSAGYYVIERQSGRLLPVGAEGPSSLEMVTASRPRD